MGTELSIELENLLGEYAPIVTETETITTVSGNDSVTTTYYKTNVDFGYIARALVFMLVLYSVFRMIGIALSGLFGGGKK